MRELFVAKAADLADGDRRIVVSGRLEIGVFHQNGAYFAFSNHCPHMGGPACEGLLMHRVEDVIGPDRTYQGSRFTDTLQIVCPWHGYEFDIATGEFVGDRKVVLKKYEVVRRGDDIFVVA